jgi:hypothetical protein
MTFIILVRVLQQNFDAIKQQQGIKYLKASAQSLQATGYML